MDDHELKQALKELLVTECDKEDELDWESISDDEALIGDKSRIGMDSLDALQMALAVQQEYGVRIEGSRDARRAFRSISALSDYIRKHE